MSGDKKSRVFLMVTSDLPPKGRPDHYAIEVVEARLERRLWPLYERTANRKAIEPGCIVLFYVGGQGKGAGCIVASAVVAQKRTNRSGSRVDDPKLGTDAPDQILALQDVAWATPPVPFKEALDAAGVAYTNVGALLQGGCRAVPDPHLIERLTAHRAPADQGA